VLDITSAEIPSCGDLLPSPPTGPVSGAAVRPLYFASQSFRVVAKDGRVEGRNLDGLCTCHDFHPLGRLPRP